MCWGLEVGDGWFTLIDNMCFLIQNHIDWMEKKNTPILGDVSVWERTEAEPVSDLKTLDESSDLPF